MIDLAPLIDANVAIKRHSIDIVEIPFKSTVHLPFGSIDHRPSAWLRLEGEVDGAECSGAAEGTSLPIQIPMYDDFSGNLAGNISTLVEVIGTGSASVAEVRQRIASAALGGNFATARMTVEAGLIDMVARSKDESVYSLLSGDMVSSSIVVPYGKSIAENDRSRIIEAGELALSRGAGRLKFKVSPANYGSVIEGIRKLQNKHTAVTYMVDANGMFDPEDDNHLAILQDIDSLNLAMIEEPVSRAGRLAGLAAHRALRGAMRFTTPIALDDSISSQNDARIALEDDLGDIINLKPGRVGSFIDCIDMANIAKTRDKQIMVGGMFEATPGRMMTLTLAALCLRQGFDIPGDVSLPQERLASDIVESTLRLDEHHNVLFSPTHGWGYEI